MTKKKSDITVNCKYCKYAGEEQNHMCFCSSLSVFRSIGVRVCKRFEIDKRKYNKIWVETTRKSGV